MNKQKLLAVIRALRPYLDFLGAMALLLFGSGLMGPLRFAFNWTETMLYRLTFPLVEWTGVDYEWDDVITIITFVIHYCLALGGLLIAIWLYNDLKAYFIQTYKDLIAIRDAVRRWIAKARIWMAQVRIWIAQVRRRLGIEEPECAECEIEPAECDAEPVEALNVKPIEVSQGEEQ